MYGMKHTLLVIALTITALASAATSAAAPAGGGGRGATALPARTARRAVPANSAQAQRLSIDPDALKELLPLAARAADIFQRATAREARHAAELRKRGIAEVPPEGDERYVVDTAGIGEFAFDDRGEIYIDRRFVTDEEMKTVRAIEGWIVKWFPRQTEKRRMLPAAAGGAAVPTFRGFRSDRYQKHDALIARLTKEFNADKVGWCGGTPAQAAQIPDLTPAQVKAHMIEESGGNGPVSKAAWAADPLQVNVPGDWGEEKTKLGLSRPSKRNEGTAETNVRAAIKYLARKGFGVSGRPAAVRPNGTFDGWRDAGTFDGWREACRRYNGRRDRTDSDRYYSDEYADKIMRRAANPDLFVPIEIKLAAPKAPQNPPAAAPQKPSDPA